MNSAFGTPRFRLFCLRYATAASAQCETGTMIPAADLPDWLAHRFPGSEVAAGRVAAEALRASRGAETVDLYVPLPDSRSRRDPAAWLAAASVYRVAPNAVLLSTTAPDAPTHRYGYAETLLALACCTDATSADLVFQHRRASATSSDLEHLRTRYGIAAAGEADAAVAEFTLRMPAASLCAWREVPAEGTNAFYRTFFQVSGHIQTLLRTWLRYEWPSDLARFDDLVASRASIMYWLSAPHRGNSRTEFTHDVFALDSVKKLCRVGANRYGAELDRIGERLNQAGRTAAAHCYRSLHTREIMAAVKKERRTIARFIAAESEIADILIKLSVRARSYSRVRDMAEAASGALYALRTVLHRLPVAGWEHDLAILILMEATSALQVAAGVENTLQATLRLVAGENKRAA